MEIRTRIYPTEVKFYCDKCAVWLEPEDPKLKNPNLTYLLQEEFDKIISHIYDDSVLRVFSVEEIIRNAKQFSSIDELVRSLVDVKKTIDPTVKFFGELTFQGGQFTYVRPEDHQQATDYTYKCSNPSCKFETILQRQYPFVENVVGRLVREPNELQHPDDYIRNVMKKHVGSTIMSNPEILT